MCNATSCDAHRGAFERGKEDARHHPLGRGRRWAERSPLAVALLCSPLWLGASSLAGQSTRLPSEPSADPRASSDWNSPEAIRLIERATAARRHAYADSSLLRFRADVQGHVYFLGEFLGEREVIRADQVALDVRWQAPDRALQTIVGRRDEVRLPTDIRYHIDHLSLVLDNFGDRIRLGEGDEVRNVLHPAAAGSLGFYEFRLAGSQEIRILDRVARLIELEVRPLDTGNPGVVGSVFVDRESGAIARMRLTFTHASYRDSELVRIVLDLKSALIEGRYWLPIEQDLEIVRSLSWLQFPLETVIRTRLEVLDYRLNEQPPFALGTGQAVATLTDEALERFDEWSTDLYDGPIGARERSDEELGMAMSRAQDLVRRRGLVGGGRLQFALPNASAGLRARRAEGLLVGAGGAYRIDDGTRLSFWGGHPSAAGRPEASVGLTRASGGWEAELEGWLRAHRDVGRPAASGALRTLALATQGEDYEDPYFEDGGRLALARRTGAVRTEVGASLRRQRAADLVVRDRPIGGQSVRPVRPIDEGELFALDLGIGVELGDALGASWTAGLSAEAATGAIGSFGYTRAMLMLGAVSDASTSGWAWSSEMLLGLAGGTLPAQRLFLLGGRGTLPGYDFRPWGGDRTAIWRGEVSRAIRAPWVRIRALGAAGWTDLGDPGGSAASRFGVRPTGEPRAAVGFGLGLLYDLLRIDLVRGLSHPEGVASDWTLLVSLDPLLWGIL